jgi:hypothetical protein
VANQYNAKSMRKFGYFHMDLGNESIHTHGLKLKWSRYLRKITKET